MELVRRPHARNMVRFAADRPEVLVLSADLTSSCEVDDFRDAFLAQLGQFLRKAFSAVKKSPGAFFEHRQWRSDGDGNLRVAGAGGEPTY